MRILRPKTMSKFARQRGRQEMLRKLFFVYRAYGYGVRAAQYWARVKLDRETKALRNQPRVVLA